MPLLPGTVRSQFTFRPISPERAAGGASADENGEAGRLGRLSPESDSGRSYSSRSRSESGSRRSEEGSRTPEEDMSRATTPGNTTELGAFLLLLIPKTMTFLFAEEFNIRTSNSAERCGMCSFKLR
jgi:hypothetical protein